VNGNFAVHLLKFAGGNTMFPSFTLLGRELGLYSLMILCGIFSSGIYACLMAKKFDYDYSDLIIFLLFISSGVVLGSHSLYTIVNYNSVIYIFENIKKINTFEKLFSVLNYLFGGSVFYGGLFGGLIAGHIVSKNNSKYRNFFDIGVTSIPLFHFFGRIGCFLGGCCYGIESNIGFIYTKNPIIEANGIKRFPVQILEAIFDIILFFLLNHLLRHEKLKDKILYVYLSIYTIGRFFIEFFRGDAYRGIWFSLSTSQIISILIILVLIVRFCYECKSKRTLKHPCLGQR
jgi:phosphatidylglycerol:prolipoprotein diacylglycerol transferase